MGVPGLLMVAALLAPAPAPQGGAAVLGEAAVLDQAASAVLGEAAVLDQAASAVLGEATVLDQAASAESPAQVSSEATLTSPDIPLKPAEIVASRVREVLRDHDDDAAWQELAVALPELALVGDADIESTFAAARMAEDMVPAASPIPTPITMNDPGRVALELLRGVDADLLGQVFAIVFGLLAVSMLLKSSAVRGRNTRVEPTAARCKQARTLAAEGVPAYEISRRTGLARDAVSVLLSRNPR